MNETMTSDAGREPAGTQQGTGSGGQVVPLRNIATGPIAIQGYEGSFHQMAARIFYGSEVEVITCDTFREVVNLASSGARAGGGVMAIENSIAGSILPNYNLLQQGRLHIAGEIYLQIEQQLMANPGVRIEDIREVHSHTMALQQCFGFLDRHQWKLVETDDTALSAKLLQQNGSRNTAAIASRLAAELYGLEILAPDIQTLKNNYTRFLVVLPGEEPIPVEGANKASVKFHTDHSRGSLARVLTLIAEGNVNLSKLQSIPLPNSEFMYAFHADMEFDSIDDLNRVLETIQPVTESMKVYGIYRKGVWKTT